jgi:hypothetical protein
MVRISDLLLIVESQTAEYEQKVHKLDVGLRCLSGFFLSCMLVKKQVKFVLQNSVVLTINKQVKALESVVEELKLENSRNGSSSAKTGSESALKVKGSLSPFTCMGMGLALQMSPQHDAKYFSYRCRIEELEALASSRQKEVPNLLVLSNLHQRDSGHLLMSLRQMSYKETNRNILC